MSQFENIGKCEDGYAIGNCTICGANGVIVSEHSCLPRKFYIMHKDGTQREFDYLENATNALIAMARDQDMIKVKSRDPAYMVLINGTGHPIARLFDKDMWTKVLKDAIK